MYKDVKQWQQIRRLILIDGVSKRRVMREIGIHWSTLMRILSNPTPPGYQRKRKEQYQRQRDECLCSLEQVGWDILRLLAKEDERCLRTIDSGVSTAALSRNSIRTNEDDCLLKLWGSNGSSNFLPWTKSEVRPM